MEQYEFIGKYSHGTIIIKQWEKYIEFYVDIIKHNNLSKVINGKYHSYVDRKGMEKYGFNRLYGEEIISLSQLLICIGFYDVNLFIILNRLYWPLWPDENDNGEFEEDIKYLAKSNLNFG